MQNYVTLLTWEANLLLWPTLLLNLKLKYLADFLEIS